jgi:hypothetical protein
VNTRAVLGELREAPANDGGARGALGLFDPIVELIAERVAEKLRAAEARMVAQHGSELGARGHREAVKRRLDGREGGAAIRGRRFLLTPEAYREELLRPSTGARPTVAKTRKSGGTEELTPYERELLVGLRKAQKGR